VRGRFFCLIGLIPTLALAACGSGDEETPAACLGDADAYLTALAAAPGEVKLEGETPISACLVSGQEPGELGRAGAAIVAAATQLNETARQDPSGPAAVQLGYLVGAVQEGSSDTGGIHADLVRRLDSAARFSPPAEGGEQLLPAEFERAFGRGYSAGQESG
jgi:hypothetical protein